MASTPASAAARASSGEVIPQTLVRIRRVTIRLLYDLDGTVVVAMIAMRMMEMSIDQVVDMIAMGHGLVTTPRAMRVLGIVPAAGMLGSAHLGVGGVDVDRVFFDFGRSLVMEVAIVQIVDMVAMLHAGMSATGAMLVVVGMMRHRYTSTT